MKAKPYLTYACEGNADFTTEFVYRTKQNLAAKKHEVRCLYYAEPI